MGLKNCIYTSRIGVGRSNMRNHPYLGYAVSASPRESQPSHHFLAVSFFLPWTISTCVVSARALVALAEPPEQRFIRASNKLRLSIVF
ncbi:hypothetical protein ARMGADRAFT_1171253, partial [Armillaria gallica]